MPTKANLALRSSSVLLISLSLLTGQAWNLTYEQEDEIAVTVGTSGSSGGPVFGSHISSLDAIWNASHFVMYDNGTFAFNMTLRYLPSVNPTSSSIFNTTTQQDEPVVTNGQLSYLGSIVLVRVAADYVMIYNWTDGGEVVYLTDVMVVDAIDVDNQTSFVSFKGEYDKSKDHPTAQTDVELSAYQIKLSWLRVFLDEAGNRYYQVLYGNQSCGEWKHLYCDSQIVDLNQQYQSLSGTLSDSMPVPESMMGEEYVSWVQQNIKVIPEFGSISLLVGAVGVASILVLSSWKLHQYR
ncbi:MAG: hypothetical protein HRF40_11540 [Nitrososphaera sp.]